MSTAIGQNVHRKEAWDKVSGRAQYTDDLPATGFLSARLLTSPHAHARILGIDTDIALAVEGVNAVITGKDCPQLFGPLLQDRPALAIDTVRYAGEPVAIVVAVDEPTAERAARLIQVRYEPLPAVFMPSDALRDDAPLLHPKATGYTRMVTDVNPEPNTNIASSFRIRKGDTDATFQNEGVVVRQRFSLPPSDHLPMETHTARAEISADGAVVITTSSQAPYAVRTLISEVFRIPAGNIQVRVPLVGGGFGGKAPVMPELLAYIASCRVNGRPVRLRLTREQDMASAACRLGLEADISLIATKEGLLQAARMTYWLDCGAYSDISPNMTKAIAADCTGPYRIENVSCDAFCVYTNHTYATSYRGFAHEAYTFCVERTMDSLARALHMDPLELRLKNAIRSGCTTPTQADCTPSAIGDLPQCIEKLKTLCEWAGAEPVEIKPGVVKVRGVACFWKTENPPTNAVSGAVLTCNSDGSLNLNTGVVEMGSGSQTHLAQMLAEKLQIDVGQIHVSLPVDTRLNPEHWKTVASLTGYMAGNAVMRAADDLLAQLRNNGAQALGCSQEEIEVAHGRVFQRDNPEKFISFADIINGYTAPDGTSIGEPALGRGGFMLKGLTTLDPRTGRGKTGPSWTLGAQMVEVEVDISEYTYRLLCANTVIDIGKVINPDAMRCMVRGGMAMGVSMSSREAYHYDENGALSTPNLRTYKLLHIGQEPIYNVNFVETPQEDSPYGVRSFSEHGIIGIPAALGNALSAALHHEINRLPLIPELLWKVCTGGADDTD